MGDAFRYPVYVECGTLSSQEEWAVRHYFFIRRKSGGGECGPLTRVSGGVYRVSFEHQRDQQAVLRRPTHVVHRALSRLVLTVRESPEPRALHGGTASSPPAEQVVPASPFPSSGEECELRPGGPAAGRPEAEEDRPSPREDESSPRADAAGAAGSDDEVQDDGSTPSEDLTSGSSCKGNVRSSPSPTETGVNAAAPHPPTSTPGGRVRVEIVEGTIESQQVQALVSPMVGHDPRSSRVGATLCQTVGSQLLTEFQETSGVEVELGEPVLLEDLPGLPANAAFFLSLARWDQDPSGTAVEILRMGVRSILASCHDRGFSSVAFPVLGAGVALCFPDAVVANVLLEEVSAFEEERSSSAALLVRVVIHPSDQESGEVFRSVLQVLRPQDLDQELLTRRIVLLGKTGSGKSSLANTIFEEALFTADHSPNSGTSQCRSETRSVNGRSLTLIDTPGFFDTGRSREDVEREIASCVAECAPGPHAILILLKVEKFSEQEQEVVRRILKCFSEEALKYAVIVFTHGQQLRRDQTIEGFVRESPELSRLVSRCGGRCHVFDNAHWSDAPRDHYRSNRFQRQRLLETIEQLVASNGGACYTNDALQAVEQEIQRQELEVRASAAHLPAPQVRRRARSLVTQRFLTQLAGTATGTVLGAVLALVALFSDPVKNPAQVVALVKKAPALLGAPKVGGDVALATGLIAGVPAAATAMAGAVAGGIVGNEAAQDAETPSEAAQKAAERVMERARGMKLL